MHTLGFDRPLEFHLLPLLAKHLNHLGLVHLVKADIGQTVKETRLEVRHHGGWVTTKRQNLQQGGVGDKVEPGELSPFGFQIGRQGLLTELQLLQQVRQHGLHHVIAKAGRDHILGFNSIQHNLQTHISKVSPLSLCPYCLHTAYY